MQYNIVQDDMLIQYSKNLLYQINCSPAVYFLFSSNKCQIDAEPYNMKNEHSLKSSHNHFSYPCVKNILCLVYSLHITTQQTQPCSDTKCAEAR